MKKFDASFTSPARLPQPKPDFENILKVLRRERPDRYTLFEFFLNQDLYNVLSGHIPGRGEQEKALEYMVQAFYRAGYDYVTILASNFSFPHKNNDHAKSSISVNEGAVITDWESYEAYHWPNPEDYYDGRVERLNRVLPEGMKFILYGPSGVLENTMALMGYDNLCYLLADEPQLVEEVFRQVGQRIYNYYEQCAGYDCIGAFILNDDWGFNMQTMLSPDDMRRLVFPWHKKMAALAHAHGKPVILHSCGKLTSVYDDLIDDIGFDGKHSYEDKIQPVEEAYDMYADRIAIMGGIDVDFVCRQTPEKIYARSCAMLEKTQCKGYALGTGNSVASYVPQENYFAMIAAAVQNR